MVDLTISPTSVFYLGTTKLIVEDTPYEKYSKLLTKMSIQFFLDEICPNSNLHENLRKFLSEVQAVTVPAVYRVIE